MQYARDVLMWMLDVTVAVFIGPVEGGSRAARIKRLASRRGVYAFGYACAMVLVMTVYTVATRTPGNF